MPLVYNLSAWLSIRQEPVLEAASRNLGWGAGSGLRQQVSDDVKTQNHVVPRPDQWAGMFPRSSTLWSKCYRRPAHKPWLLSATSGPAFLWGFEEPPVQLENNPLGVPGTLQWEELP